MKKTDRSLTSMLSYAAAALLAVGAATAQVATAGTDASFPGGSSIDSSGSFRSEMQSCMSGKTQQDRETCMKEARNAAAEKSRGRLETYGANDQHAVARCDVHPAGEDRAACQARVMGMGSVDGSVAGGGLIREVETVVLPAGQNSITVEPQTDAGPVVLVPSR